jgi:putative holliday junction resolvase
MGAQTIMAFDFGTQRIGVATGQSITRHAQPLTVLHVSSRSARIAAIAPLVGQWQPDMLVVGRPLYPDGATHEMTLLAEKFARAVSERFAKPYTLVDERYSSVEAAKMIGHLDSNAAVIIAEQYLNSLP